MSRTFFSRINYSASNEDSESERRALRLNSDDTVLCITGSGARTLDLLVDAPATIVSIDFNPAQNFLLELKMAAFQTFTYQEMVAFLGVHECDKREAMFDEIRAILWVPAQQFWEANRSLIRNGVLYCGTWEHLLRKMLKYAFFRRRKIRRLTAASSLEEQREIWKKEWDNWTWRLFLKVLCNRFLWVYLVREPGAKLIPRDFNVQQYMRDRLEHLAFNYRFKSNHYAQLMFQGKYDENCVLPHHLRPENFEIVRQHLNRVEIVTATLTEYLSEQKDRFTKFSLSDFSSYAPKEVYASIWESLLMAAKPNAIFCERYFLVKRHPEKQFSELHRDSRLEEQLWQQDETAIYSFAVGTVLKYLEE